MMVEAVPVEAVMPVETGMPIEAVMPVEASMANCPGRVTTAEARTACAARFARQIDCQYDRQRGDRDEYQLSRTSKPAHVFLLLCTWDAKALRQIHPRAVASVSV
jgi:hypothetical protein